MKFYLIALVITIATYINFKNDDNKKKLDMNIKFFRDFNEISLVGIDEQKNRPTSFPYVEVQYKRKKIIKYIVRVNERIFFEKEFIKVDDKEYLLFKRNHKSDEGCVIYTLSYFKNNEKISIDYCNSPKDNNFWLISLTKYTNKSSIEFSYPPESYKIKPSHNFLTIMPSPFSTIYRNYEIDKEILSYREKRVDNWDNNSITYDDLTCYKLSNQSFFWWSYVGASEEVNCE